MNKSKNKDILRSSAYAAPAEFERIFTEDMSGLYLLSFLLTGDRDKAEECFVAGVGESIQGNRVFKEWARSWVRRTIIQSAIRLVAPHQRNEGGLRDSAATRSLDKLPLALQAEVSAILKLAPFERFVLIMSTLERYSDHDCSILLGCTPKDVAAARAHALQQLGHLINSQENEADLGSEDSALGGNPTPVTELTIARYFGTPAWSTSLSHDAPLWP